MPKCCNDNIELTSDPDATDDWAFIDVDINYEDIHLVCDHCGQLVESAYSEPDEGDCDDSDDGQVLASAGRGTDEDYGSAEDML